MKLRHRRAHGRCRDAGFFVVAVVAVAVFCTAPDSGRAATVAGSCSPPDSGEHRVAVDGDERSYVVVVPDESIRPAPWPVVIALHGTGGSADHFGEASGLGLGGTAAGALVVLPDGIGDPAGWQHADRQRDLEFVDAVIDEVVASGCVDAERLWVTGVSAGSAMAAALVCDRSGVTGAVLVAGLPAPCDTVDASVYVVHGTADDIIPYGGGDFNGVDLATMPEVVAGWAAAAGCTSTPSGRGVEPDVFVLEWPSCGHDAGGVVALYSVIGGGHGWFTDGEAGIDATCLVIAAATTAASGSPDASSCEG